MECVRRISDVFEWRVWEGIEFDGFVLLGFLFRVFVVCSEGVFGFVIEVVGTVFGVFIRMNWCLRFL